MNTLISNTQVVALAFDAAEYVAPQSIDSASIEAATTRFIEPIVGRPLMEAVRGGAYPALLNDYIAPALALGVRFLLQPSLNVRLTTAGLTQPDSTSTAIVAASAELSRSLAVRLRTLCRRLTDHLNANAAEYAEYAIDQNPQNRCTIYGGVVQIR